TAAIFCPRLGSMSSRTYAAVSAGSALAGRLPPPASGRVTAHAPPPMTSAAVTARATSQIGRPLLDGPPIACAGSRGRSQVLAGGVVIAPPEVRRERPPSAGATMRPAP